MGVNPTVKEGAVYVPFRFIGEALNAKVLWHPDSKTVVIYKPVKLYSNAMPAIN
ncbi:hypothetical protein C1I59_12025 [Paenibacillus polymyxa]|uniref:stalk domain-containing protein n=1 Tax=Paenibacillus polymyxa TaxID=1406 RepID=UPI0010BF03C2|nr:hypothetical protein C1I59_12025 [Paenibacillus polymyxa]